jgi:hypothetical protein
MGLMNKQRQTKVVQRIPLGQFTFRGRQITLFENTIVFPDVHIYLFIYLFIYFYSNSHWITQAE